ncbi:unnamed protein product [Rhodiola kirilowii]
MRKELLKNWALKWGDFTHQPVDDIQSYFGTQIATYFSFLGMFTRWPMDGLSCYFRACSALRTRVLVLSIRPLKSLLLPVFFVSITLWAISFCQFWKRKYSALLVRWQIEYVAHSGPALNPPGIQDASIPSNTESITNSVKTRKGKEAIQRLEWFKFLMRFRNDAMMIFSIICLQLPFELAYAHLYEVIESGIIRFGLTGAYLLAIQYFTRTGGRISVGLIKHESAENKEYQANSLVYKVFGLYFMQSYIGLLYHALFHRNFNTLREMLLERLIITEVLQNFVESSLPYLRYINSKKNSILSEGKVKFTTKTEMEYLKPTYAASIGEEFEDGLFDDYLELALRFGLVMMFSCAFPLVFAFAFLIWWAGTGHPDTTRATLDKAHDAPQHIGLPAGICTPTIKQGPKHMQPNMLGSVMDFAQRSPGGVLMSSPSPPNLKIQHFLSTNHERNVLLQINLMEIRMDAFKLLTMFKRPVPRVAETNGAWLNIFQFLIVTSICTNCAILICLYDKEGKWNIEPGLAAILVMEHVLLLVKFGISRFVPEEPAWMRANRLKNVAQAQDACSKQLLGSVSGERKEVYRMGKDD